MADFRKRYRVWLKQSKFDLEASELSYNNKFYEWSCYQSTQSFEKTLKAVIVHSGYLPPQTHKLGVLVSIANRSNRLFEQVKFNFRKIETYTFFARYPFVIPGRDSTPHEMIDREDAETCLNLSKNIMAKVEEFLENVPAASETRGIDMADYYYTSEEVQARLDDILAKLKTTDKLKISKIVLFGGFARERTRPKTSTMDLLIIAETELTFFERIHHVRLLTKGSEPIIEPLVYTKEEFNTMLHDEGEGFLESALKEGKTIFQTGEEKKERTENF